ncbi:MAG: DUF805 domain-containing protein [Mangrovibacterium sp.]
MRKYYYTKGHEMRGPFNVDMLGQENITTDTLVWCEGLSEWTKAGEFSELRVLFELQPPPIPKNVEVIVSDNSSRRNDSSEMEEVSVFSFKGRISRTIYCGRFILYCICYFITLKAIQYSGSVWMLTFVPLLWFIYAQNAKRCHDIGKSGWWQMIPLYIFWLFFKKGQKGANKYGFDPKQ